jgi:hypothetical protein
MKTLLLFTFLLAFSAYAFCQDVSRNAGHAGRFSGPIQTEADSRFDGYPISGFALSFNPIGFFQYGPTINAEFGLTRNLVFHAHIRFKAFGLQSTSATGYNEFSSALADVALGGGPIYFIGARQSKPYIGFVVDCSTNGPVNHANTNTFQPCEVITIAYTVNTGYRMRFDNGLFINGGLFAGISSKCMRWNTTEINNSDFQQENRAFFMGELTIGFEF